MNDVEDPRQPDWLPEVQPRPSRTGLPPWDLAEVRARLAPDEDWERVRYVVVDELHEGVAGLVISPWPGVDRWDRLVFGDEDDSRRIATGGDDLLALLRTERLPVLSVAVDDDAEEALRDRPLSIGDVFAARIGDLPGSPGGGGSGGDQPTDPKEWMQPPVLDVTAEALEAARRQTNAAALGVLDEQLVEAISDEFEDGDGPTTPQPDPERSPPGGQSSGGTQAPAAGGEQGDAAGEGHLPSSIDDGLGDLAAELGWQHCEQQREDEDEGESEMAGA